VQITKAKLADELAFMRLQLQIKDGQLKESLVIIIIILITFLALINCLISFYDSHLQILPQVFRMTCRFSLTKIAPKTNKSRSLLHVSMLFKLIHWPEFTLSQTTRDKLLWELSVAQDEIQSLNLNWPRPVSASGSGKPARIQVQRSNRAHSISGVLPYSRRRDSLGGVPMIDSLASPEAETGPFRFTVPSAPARNKATGPPRVSITSG
jgi:hypothetical protein